MLDEGPTRDEVRRWCLDQGAAEGRVAVLTWKRHGRGLPSMVPDYWGLEVPDRYVFGFGMDYYEQGRNLPAIYALRDCVSMTAPRLDDLAKIGRASCRERVCQYV